MGTVKVSRSILGISLIFVVGAALMAGCTVRTGSIRSTPAPTLLAATITPFPTGTATSPATPTLEPAASSTPLPIPTATPVTTVTSVITVTAVPTVTTVTTATAVTAALSPTKPVTGTTLFLPLTGDLAATSTITLGQFAMRFPENGFLRQSPRKQVGTAATGQNPFLTLFPELSRLPAPAWLKEGMRVTYRVESASIAQKPGLNGSSGAGFYQYDLVAMENDLAVSSASLFSDLNGTLLPSTVARNTSLPGVGEYWMNPVVLKGAERVAGGSMAVVPTRYKVGNKTYNATRFQYKTEDAEYGWVFDDASGLLLFYTSAIGNDKSDYKQLAQATLVQQRQMRLPWRVSARSTVPAWATRGATLNYGGTYSVVLPDGSSTPVDLTVAATISSGGRRWTEVQAKTSIRGQSSSTSVEVTGVYQPFGGYWLPAEALRALRDGQVVDRDPTTGTTIKPSRTRSTVSLTEQGANFTTVLTYNATTGMLTSLEQDMQNGAGTIQIQLQLENRD